MKPELIAAKRATEEMIKGVGGYDAAPGFCRIRKSALQECSSLAPINTSRFVPIDVLADLEPLARDRQGWPHVKGRASSKFTRAPTTLPGCKRSLAMRTRPHSRTRAPPGMGRSARRWKS